MTQPSSDTSACAGRKISIAIGGGISCYKIGYVVSQLVQKGAEVRVLMTESAERFVAPLTFTALSGRSVLSSIWQLDDHPDSQHVGVARWCDIFVVAPATADLIARFAAGLCDNVVALTACALPQDTPVLLAPAMNAQMWESPITQRNFKTLMDLGWHSVGPDTGWQACRSAGAGRMSEPAAIIEAIASLLADTDA